MNPTKGIIYYTDNRVDPKIAVVVREYIRQAGLPIVSTSLEPISDMGKNIHVKMERGYKAMFTQILIALEESDSDIIFFCEHDNIYHPTHFDFTPPKKDVFYYDLNWWKVREDGYAVHWDAEQVSGLCCYRELAIDFYRKRLTEFDPDNFDRKFEPQSGEGSEDWFAEFPSIDIRRGHNLTYNKWTLDHFRDKSTAKNFQVSDVDHIPGWENLRSMLE